MFAPPGGDRNRSLADDAGTNRCSAGRGPATSIIPTTRVVDYPSWGFSVAVGNTPSRTDVLAIAGRGADGVNLLASTPRPGVGARARQRTSGEVRDRGLERWPLPSMDGEPCRAVDIDVVAAHGDTKAAVADLDAVDGELVGPLG